ncbi:MAG TPA: S8 family serine peptidase [Thermoanaerobaculia bacterium]|nr:S8 family serine peptidase [Thermoanaerobaculia bacterium]
MPDRLCTSVAAARKRPAVWLAGLFLLGVVHAAGAAAPEIRIEPTTLHFGAAPAASTAAAVAAQGSQAPAASSPAVWQSLREKASDKGRVRVIVRLKTTFSPEGRLSSPAAVRRQRTAIRGAQGATLEKLAGSNARLHARFKYVPFLALEVDAEALERLRGFPEVAGIEEDTYRKPLLVSSTATIGSGVAWNQGLGGSGQVIAVLDTGVDKTHPFFAGGKVVAEACYSTTAGGTTSLCPGGVAESTQPGSGASCPAEVAGCDHGTHVAGIAAGNDGAGPGFGVARDAGIIAIQVFSRVDDFSFCWPQASCAVVWVSDEIKGLERVYELAEQFDIAAVNLSVGSGWTYSSRLSCDQDNPAEKAAIDTLRSIDVATVVASGNNFGSGWISAPACISSAVAVGATDDADNVAQFSNISSFLDLLAPGVAVESSVPGGGTASFQGTSMAAPHVAGAWAVLKQANPSATVLDLLAVLRNTAVSVSGRGISDMRRIDLGRAVTTGPALGQQFTIHNDGNAVLSVLSLELEQHVSWIDWSPEAPFDVAPGGSKQVTVTVDVGRAPDGVSMNRLVVVSTDSDESPYPDAVHLVVNKQPCHVLTRSRTGSGGLPVASPGSSPGCPAGEYHAGTAVQLTATPAIGWGVESWSGTDDDFSASLSNTVTVPEGGHAVAVTYFARCYALTRTHTGSGADPVAVPANSPGCPDGQYKYAEPIALTAAPAAGWRVGSWSGTIKDTSTRMTNSLSMPAAAHSVGVNYFEGLVQVLLVDNDDQFSFRRGVYISALDALGLIHESWRIAEEGREPDAATLASYPVVIWFTVWWNGSGPSPAAEASLATYLQGGGRFFMASEDYLWDRGLTQFAKDYLGIQSTSFFSDFRSTVRGQGSAFGGLGPYDFFNDAVQVQPGPGAEAIFLGRYASNPEEVIAVGKVGPAYRTVFLGFDFENLSETAGQEVLGTALGFLGTVFADVPPGHWAKSWIEAIYGAGITSGCATSPLQYCPENTVNRDQMAVFLLRAKEGAAYVPPPCTTSSFNDVPVSSPFCPWIQELANRGITGGCGNGNYCPGNPVTREQMAVFLLKTKEGSGYTPAPCETDPFSDVAYNSFFCPWIRELANRAITGGCGGGSYCPAASSTRAQMAVFLVKTFSLPVQ